MSGPRDQAVDDVTSFEQKGWDGVVEGYHRGLGAVTARVADPLLGLAGVGPGDRVLDVATGPGYLAAAAVARGADAVGVDVAPRVVALARRLVPAAEFHVADAATLPFPQASFDVAVAGFLLTHLDNPSAALAELVRVVRSGGVVALATWGTTEEVPMLGLVLGAAAEAGIRPSPELPAGPAFFRYANPAAVVALLRETGLQHPRVRKYAFRHRIPSCSALWDAVLGGTVRTAAMLNAAPAGQRALARQRFEELVTRFAVDGALQLPVTVLLAVGRAPGGAGQRRQV